MVGNFTIPIYLRPMKLHFMSKVFYIIRFLGLAGFTLHSDVYTHPQKYFLLELLEPKVPDFLKK